MLAETGLLKCHSMAKLTKMIIQRLRAWGVTRVKQVVMSNKLEEFEKRARR